MLDSGSNWFLLMHAIFSTIDTQSIQLAYYEYFGWYLENYRVE
jgi:hypothetical protein